MHKQAAVRGIYALDQLLMGIDEFSKNKVTDGSCHAM